MNDDKLKQGLALVMENYWILRDDMPKEYGFLRSIEKDLKRLISERFGWSLFVSADFIKCEKIPVEAATWMGLQEFSTKLDYVLFCCLLSYLEEKPKNSYFLLKDICMALKANYPGAEPLEWTQYQSRRALIRVIKKAVSLRIIKEIDGDLEGFASKEDSEVLYCSTIYSRYFMRTYPLNIRDYHNIKALNEAVFKEVSSVNTTRYKVYRQLFLQPALFRRDVDEATFLYLRNQRPTIQTMVNAYSDYRFDLVRDYASLALEETTTKVKIFPELRMVDDILLQLGKKIQSLVLPKDEFGQIRLERDQWRNIIKDLKRDEGYGWSKEYRENLSIEEIEVNVLKHAIEWDFCTMENETVIIRPTLARFHGEYPKEFQEGKHGK